jgi:hypothetical protein
MARLEKILFDIYGLISEGGSRFRTRGLKGMSQLFFPVHHAHPAAPAARRRLNDDGIADLGRHRCRLLRTGNFAFAPGHYRQALSNHQLARFGLIAHRRDVLGTRADELHAD